MAIIAALSQIEDLLKVKVRLETQGRYSRQSQLQKDFRTLLGESIKSLQLRWFEAAAPSTVPDDFMATILKIRQSLTGTGGWSFSPNSPCIRELDDLVRVEALRLGKGITLIMLTFGREHNWQACTRLHNAPCELCLRSYRPSFACDPRITARILSVKVAQTTC